MLCGKVDAIQHLFLSRGLINFQETSGLLNLTMLLNVTKFKKASQIGRLPTLLIILGTNVLNILNLSV